MQGPFSATPEAVIPSQKAPRSSVSTIPPLLSPSSTMSSSAASTPTNAPTSSSRGGELPDATNSGTPKSKADSAPVAATPVATAPSLPVSPRNPFEVPAVRLAVTTPVTTPVTTTAATATTPSTVPKLESATASSVAAEHSTPGNNNHQMHTPARPMPETRQNTPHTVATSPENQAHLRLPPISPSHSVQSVPVPANTPSLSPGLSGGRPLRHVEGPHVHVPTFGQQKQHQPHPPATPPSVHRRSQEATSPHLQQQQQHMVITRPPLFDDDETTEPSSAGNTAERDEYPDHDGNVNDNVQHTTVAGSVVQFLENTRRRISNSAARQPNTNPQAADDGSLDADNNEDDDGVLEGQGMEGSLICGYLQKLGRNGKWQLRWFETDGECLSYYKSSKRSKLLATLDLAKVGAILIDDEDDDKGQTFTIQVLGRLYLLRADSKASCRDWVISLNRIKEARLNQGNVKLLNPSSQHQQQQKPVDFLDQGSELHVTPRVVVVANRERTRAVAESGEFESMIRDPSDDKDPSLYKSEKRRSTVGTVVMARWTKRRTSISRLSVKLAKWARSIRKFGCSDVEHEGVYLDRHVHPPGHDDKRKSVDPASIGQSESSVSSEEGLSGWIGKETQRSARSGPEDDGAPSKPLNQSNGLDRQISVTSEDDARFLS